RTEITRGDPDPWPKSGTSDVAAGRIGKEQFLAAIEPWHGNEVVVYRGSAGKWNRQVIDVSLADAHTIVTGDLNSDGRDEIIAGFRGKPYGVYLYSLAGEKWTRHVLDRGAMAAAACSIVDIDGDGRPDIACIGFATNNLKWYRNLGAVRREDFVPHVLVLGTPHSQRRFEIVYSGSVRGRAQ
ncbi:MAG: VCBS repeat-containing protein, partial [Acidobacteriaceae bacterium]|nr:VCBS repeat-containing protein [Acidobacteriaceae bacterium]